MLTTLSFVRRSRTRVKAAPGQGEIAVDVGAVEAEVGVAARELTTGGING